MHTSEAHPSLDSTCCEMKTRCTAGAEPAGAEPAGAEPDVITVFYNRYDSFFNTFNTFPKLLTQLAQHPPVLAIQLTHFLLL